MPTLQELQAEIAQLRASQEADKTASVARSLVSVSLESWAHSFQLIAVERADSVGILATNAAAVIGLAAIAASRRWPMHWWWSLPLFVVSAIVCSVIPLLPKWIASRLPALFRPVPYTLPNLRDLYAQALANLPDEAAAQTDMAVRVQGSASRDFGAAQRRRGFNTVALGILAVGAVFTVLLFLHDFR